MAQDCHNKSINRSNTTTNPFLQELGSLLPPGLKLLLVFL